MEAIIYHLKMLGLNDKQARCYLALVELGQSTAYHIAQKAKIKRPITYVVLEELRHKGLVLKVPHAKKQLFIAKSPEELFADAEERVHEAKRALPELLALVQDKRKVRVLYFEGKEGIKEALGYALPELKQREILALYGKGKGPIPQVYYDYNQALFDQGSSVRGFAPHHVSLKEFRTLDKKYGWNIVPLDEKDFPSEVSIEITDFFVRIILYKDAQAIVIDNPDLAKTMKHVFEMLWKNK